MDELGSRRFVRIRGERRYSRNDTDQPSLPTAARELKAEFSVLGVWTLLVIATEVSDAAVEHEKPAWKTSVAGCV